jgi:MFS transporter, FSR family, fosmidomycin resistance protein
VKHSGPQPAALDSNPGSPEQDPAAGRRTLSAACAAHFAHDGIADVLYVLLPIWAHSFGLAYVQVGTLRMAYSTALACLQLPAGVLAERVGERALLAAGSVFAGICFALLAASHSYAPVASMILLAGVGSAVQHPIASTLISRAYAPGARRAALGIYNFAGDVGKMAVAAAMGLAVVAIGWRSSVVLYGAFVIAVGAMMLLLLPRAGIRQSQPLGSAAVGTGTAGWGFIDKRGFALLSAIQLLDSACRTGFLTFFPFLFIAKGASAASVGMGLALVFVGGAAGKLVCGLLAERVGILRTVVLTELATGLLIASLVVAPLNLAMLLLIPLGVALNGTSSVLYGTVADFVRDDRQSRSFGLFYTLGSAAGAVAPLIFGVVSDLAGVPAALLAIAGLVLLAVPTALLLAPHLAEGRGRAAAKAQ